MKLFVRLKNLLKEDYGFYAIIFIIAFALAFFLASNLDMKPATENDYSKLQIQEDIIKKDFNSVYTLNNATIQINSENIVITLESKECNVISTFDKDLNYQTTAKTDHYYPWYLGILMIGICSVVFALFFGYIINFIIMAIVKVIKKKSHKH